MISPSAPSETPDAAPSRDGGDAWTATLHGQIAKLDRLTDLAMEAAEIVTARMRATAEIEAEAQPAPAPALKGLGLDLNRVTRAACLAMGLQARLIAELRNPPVPTTLKSAAGKSAAGRKADLEPESPAPIDLERDRRDAIAYIVTSVAQTQHPADDDMVDRMVFATRQRLREDAGFADLLNRPIGEIIAQICQDLGLAPDWPRLADEAWARESEERTRPGAPPPFRVVIVRPPPPEAGLATAEGNWKPPGAPRPQATPPPPHPPPHEGPHVLPGELPPPRMPRVRILD